MKYNVSNQRKTVTGVSGAIIKAVENTYIFVDNMDKISTWLREDK